MKRLKLILIFIFLMALPCRGAINTFTRTIDNKNTYKNSYRWTGKSRDFILEWAQEAEDRLDGTTGNQSLYLTPGTAPTATEGRFYYDSTSDTIKYRNASGWVSLTGLAAGAAGTLDDSYNSGNTIDVDGSAVTLTVSDTDNNVALAVVQNDATNNVDGMSITMAASNTGDALYINGVTGSTDIRGDAWNMSQTAILTLANAGFINNTTNGEIEFGEASEEVSLVFTADVVTWATDTSVATMGFGVVDALIGVGSIAFDDAASTITCTGTTNAYDLTIAQAGTVDCSLILSSAGSITDALSLITTDAVGVIKISSSDVLDVDSVDHMNFDISGASADFDVDSGAGSIILDAGEAAADAILIATTNAAGGIDIDAGSGSIDIDVTGGDITIDNDGAGKNLDIDITAGSIYLDGGEADAKAIWLAATAGGIDIDTAATYDVDVDAVGGKILLTATENAGNTIHLEENGGTSGGINIFANQGTGASATTEHDASVQLHSDDGGIGLYTTANLADAVRIETNGGTSETININNLQGTGADAMTISVNAAGGDLNLQSVLGRIEIEAEEDVANAILIIADGSTASTLELFNDTGTSVTEGAASISLVSDDGGIGLYTNANLDDAILIQSDGGTTAEITIWADQGSATDSIELLSDAGGISFNAAKPVSVTNAFELDIVALPTTTPLTIAANNSGQVHMMPDTAADTTFNLPAEADGLHYKFVYIGAAEDAHDWIITTGDDLKFFIGGIVQHDIDGELVVTYYSDGNSNSKIGVLTPGAGTVVEMWCDGTNWYVTGSVVSATDAGVTFADQ